MHGHIVRTVSHNLLCNMFEKEVPFNIRLGGPASTLEGPLAASCASQILESSWPRSPKVASLVQNELAISPDLTMADHCNKGCGASYPSALQPVSPQMRR